VLHLLPETEVVLRSAGWTPDRRIEASPWIEQLRSEGFQPNDVALTVLMNVGGLRLTPTVVNDQTHCVDTVFFDPIVAATGEHDRISQWESEYHLNLFPVAEVQGGLILCCSPDSVFTLGIVRPLQSLGRSVSEMLNQLVCGKRRFPTLSLQQ
jgi:hypothetical protein